MQLDNNISLNEVSGRILVVDDDPTARTLHRSILAKQFDANVRQVAAEVGHVGDLRLFLMGALLLADELHEVKLGGSGAPVTQVTPPSDAGVAEALNAVAARIEKIAQKL